MIEAKQKAIKEKPCRICKDKFTPFKTTDVVCSKYDCRVSYALRHVENQRKEKAKAKRIKTREQREKLKTLSEYEADAKKSFQKWVRMRDKGLPCISCNNPNPSDWAGGHYFDAGMYSALIFDERNCHAQCNTNCNKHRSGNKLEYRKGLIQRYGVEFVEQLESESDSKRDYKYTKLELIEKKKYYDQKIKELTNI